MGSIVAAIRAGIALAERVSPPRETQVPCQSANARYPSPGRPRATPLPTDQIRSTQNFKSPIADLTSMQSDPLHICKSHQSPRPKHSFLVYLSQTRSNRVSHASRYLGRNTFPSIQVPFARVQHQRHARDRPGAWRSLPCPFPL
jgi:hypothetical protein